MTAIPRIAPAFTIPTVIWAEFGTEHNQVMSALSRAATLYAEEFVPGLVAALPAARLNLGQKVAFRYQGLATPTISLRDESETFPELSLIPLIRPVICPRFPAVLTLDLQTPSGVALDAAFAAMEELLDRVSRRAAELTTTTIEKVPHG